MMKKAWTIILIFVIILLSACATSEESVSKNKTRDSEEISIETEQQEENEKETHEEESQGTNPIDEVKELIDFDLYYPSDDVSGFNVEKKQVDTLSPEIILTCLAEKGVINGNIKIIDWSISEDEKKILLDFNEEFSVYVSGLGTSAEYFVIGSICNTYLNAYNCDQIKITVNGDSLVTGHAEYPSYMTKFE